MSVILVKDVVLHCLSEEKDESWPKSNLVLVLVVNGEERLRTRPLVAASASSWMMQQESIQIPLQGDLLRLIISWEPPALAHQQLGCVDLTSDELLAHCLQGDTSAPFDVVTSNGGLAFELILEFVLLSHEDGLAEVNSIRVDHELPAGLPPSSALDREHDAALDLPDYDDHKWPILMRISSQYYEHFQLSQNTIFLAKTLQAMEDGIGLVLDFVPPRQDQHDLLQRHMEMYSTAMYEFVGAFREFDDTAVDCLSGMLRKTSAVFIMLYDRFADREDLAKAISICKEAQSLVPEHHADMSAHLRRWGMALQMRFRFSGDLEDINNAILSLERCVRLTLQTDLPDRLTNLGTSYVLRSERSRSLQDISRAVAAHTRALTFREDYALLMNLGAAVLLRFTFQRDLTDAQVAVAVFTRARDLVDKEHPDLRRCLGNLAVAHHNRFEVLQKLEDIDNAIAMQQDALRILQATATHHHERSTHLASLGNAYLARAVVLRDPQDLDLAIRALSEAVDLTPPGHAQLQKRRYNLGHAHAVMYDLCGDPTDRELGIVEFDAALSLLPEGHADLPVTLIQLARTLQAKPADVDRAISLGLRALGALQQGDVRRRAAHSVLGDAYVSRFTTSAEPGDLDESVRWYEEAMHSTPEDEFAQKQCCSMQLANAYARRFEFSSMPEDRDAAITYFRLAATAPNGTPWTAFLAASRWAQEVKAQDGTAALEAYSIAIELLPRVAWIGDTVAGRHAQLVSIGTSMVTDAVAVAVVQGEHCRAVEWLEQARAIVWGQQLQLRSSLDALRPVAPDLATRLDRIARALDAEGSMEATLTPTTDVLGTVLVEDAAKDDRRSAADWNSRWKYFLEQSKLLSDYLDSIGSEMVVKHDSEQQKQVQHRHAEEWDRLVGQARAIPGFEDFLRPRTFAQISQSLQYSPLVILVPEEQGCNALVLMEELDDVLHVTLPEFTLEYAQRLRDGFRRLLSNSNLRQRSDRAAELVPTDPSMRGIKDILAELWTGLVKPILDALAITAAENDDLPRIWWCPTGPLAFLPIHAAGIYTTNEPGTKLADYAISSYTLTLAPLANRPLENTEMQGILCVSQSATLPGAELEAVCIERLALQADVKCKRLRDKDGTVDAVLEGMEEHGWIHLACHGVQDLQQPAKSRFMLYDGSLQLLEIIAASFTRADFAFLSACQTATGAYELPDEAAHLAAGMLAAGFRSIIATMWSIRDADAPVVAEEVYRRLLLGGGQPDSSRAASALHHAVKLLREKNEKSFTWLPFIHVGL